MLVLALPGWAWTGRCGRCVLQCCVCVLQCCVSCSAVCVLQCCLSCSAVEDHPAERAPPAAPAGPGAAQHPGEWGSAVHPHQHHWVSAGQGLRGGSTTTSSSTAANLSCSCTLGHSSYPNLVVLLKFQPTKSCVCGW